MAALMRCFIYLWLCLFENALMFFFWPRSIPSYFASLHLIGIPTTGFWQGCGEGKRQGEWKPAFFPWTICFCDKRGETAGIRASLSIRPSILYTGFFKSIRTKENDTFSHPILRFEIWKLHQKAQEIRFLLNGVQILRCFSFTSCNNMV